MNRLAQSNTDLKKRSTRRSSTGKINALHFIAEYCDYCGCCVAVCPVDCIELEEARLTIDFERCTFCGNCPCACPVGALEGVTA